MKAELSQETDTEVDPVTKMITNALGFSLRQHCTMKYINSVRTNIEIRKS